MIILDFGPSNYEKNAPGISIIDAGKVAVPDAGALEPVSHLEDQFRDTLESYLKKIEQAKVEPGTVLNRPAISIDLPAQKGWEELYLIWINERHEWIGIHKKGWLESMAWGDDETYSGPYALDWKYAKKILEAYKIPSEKTSLEQVLTTAPSELEKIK